MDFAVVQAAKWDRELIADLAAERADLGEAQMMRVHRFPPADEAWTRSHELDVSPISVASDFGKPEHTLVDSGARSSPVGRDWRYNRGRRFLDGGGLRR